MTLTVPPTAAEICVGLLKCPADPGRHLLWRVPVKREPPRMLLVSLPLGVDMIPLEHLQRFPVLEFEWCGDSWSYRGWAAG